MNIEKIFIQKRDCKNTNAIRKNGKIPGIIYGKNFTNLLFEVGEIELNSIISKTGEHGLTSVNYEGQDYKVLIKEIQKDPIKNNIIHIDLEHISNSNNILNTEISIIFSGEELVRKRGGVIQKEKNSVKVRCNEKDLPQNIKVDLSKYDIDKTFRVCDLEISDDITFMEDLDSVIAYIFVG